jgi:quinol monooxygenase YgiN
MKESYIGQDITAFTVIFDFDVTPTQQAELAEKLPGLVSEIVSKQPGFLAAHLHLSTDGEKVLNYFQWENKQAFETFRQNEDIQKHIRPVLQQYKPTPRVYEIAFSAVSYIGE